MIKNKTLNPELNHHSLQGGRSRALTQALPALNRRWNSSSQAVGFTIIEVVLVLAIAGLIFLMVFIALPALQRAQRNSQYKNNVGIAITMMQNYLSNNRNQMPPFAADGAGMEVGVSGSYDDHPFYNYVQNSGLPEGVNVKISTGYTVIPSLNVIKGRIIYLLNRACIGPSVPLEVGAIFAEAKTGGIVVITILEEGSNGMIYCENVR